MSERKRGFIVGALMIAECCWMAFMPVAVGIPGMFVINGLAFYILLKD